MSLYFGFIWIGKVWACFILCSRNWSNGWSNSYSYNFVQLVKHLQIAQTRWLSQWTGPTSFSCLNSLSWYTRKGGQLQTMLGEVRWMHLLGLEKVLIHGNMYNRCWQKELVNHGSFKAQFEKRFGKARNLDHRLYVGSPS
jgi:hypothetical protein